MQSGYISPRKPTKWRTSKFKVEVDHKMGEVVGDAGGGRNAPFTWFTAPDTSTAEQQAVLTVIHRNIYFNILLLNVKQTNKYIYN